MLGAVQESSGGAQAWGPGSEMPLAGYLPLSRRARLRLWAKPLSAGAARLGLIFGPRGRKLGAGDECGGGRGGV